MPGIPDFRVPRLLESQAASHYVRLVTGADQADRPCNVLVIRNVRFISRIH